MMEGTGGGVFAGAYSGGHCDMSPPLTPKAPLALVGALDGSKAPKGGYDPQGRSGLSSQLNAPSLGRSSEGALDL